MTSWDFALTSREAVNSLSLGIASQLKVSIPAQNYISPVSVTRFATCKFRVLALVGWGLQDLSRIVLPHGNTADTIFTTKLLIITYPHCVWMGHFHVLISWIVIMGGGGGIILSGVDIYINIFPRIFIMYNSMLVTSRHNVWLFLKLDNAKL